MDFWLGGELGPAGHIEWLAPQWTVLLAAGGALVAFAVAWAGERALVSRLAEMLCWGLALLGVVVALSGPTWVEEEGRTEPGRTAVLIDASTSMSVLDGKTPRSDRAAEVLAELKGSDVDIYHFGDSLELGEPSAFDLPGTDVEGALEALQERLAGDKLASVVVVSDGLDRGLARRRFQDDETPFAVSTPGPITVFQAGSSGLVRDLAVRSIDAGGFAFHKENFRIRAEIQGHGFANKTVTASLTRDGAPLNSSSVTLDEQGHGEVEFEVLAQDVGRFGYAVEVPVYEGDAVPANNAMPVVVRVVREGIKVLQVTGTPSWDVKFMRRFLKEDPSVELVSFFILRTTEDLDSNYRDSELSLIAFPYQQLFTTDLWKFDVVIFQNFDHEPFFGRNAPELLGNIKKYVEGGKAFVMVGGDRSFDLGDYAHTPIADILPVQLGVAEGQQSTEGRFKPVLTEDGQRHPVTRLVSNPEENEAWWNRLSELDGSNLVRGVHPDAAVLLEHPVRKLPNGEPMPVLSVREAGKGRTMALSVDASWRWSFSEAAEGRGNQAYLRFWKNAFRWLIDDPSASRVTVETPRENYVAGEIVRVVVRARDTGFSPMPGAKVIAEVSVDGRGEELEGVTNADGEVVLDIPAKRQGSHRVRVSVKEGERVVGNAETLYAVTRRDPELDEVAPDARFLKWIAQTSHGVYYAPGEMGPVVHDPDAGRTVWDRRETPLWRAPLVGLWIVLLGGLAWLIRRRAGLS